MSKKDSLKRFDTNCKKCGSNEVSSRHADYERRSLCDDCYFENQHTLAFSVQLRTKLIEALEWGDRCGYAQAAILVNEIRRLQDEMTQMIVSRSNFDERIARAKGTPGYDFAAGNTKE